MLGLDGTDAAIGIPSVVRTFTVVAESVLGFVATDEYVGVSLLVSGDELLIGVVDEIAAL